MTFGFSSGVAPIETFGIRRLTKMQKESM
jgi:hypothetical protein